MNITHYIQERIEELKVEENRAYSYSSMKYTQAIAELQAVLSKIEENK